MSTPDTTQPDVTFLPLFRHAGREAAALVAAALGPAGRSGLLHRGRYAPAEGFCDWIAEHGESEEVEAVHERWGLTRRQAALAAARSDLGPALTSAVGAGRTAVPSGQDEAHWRATPAGRFRNSFGTAVPPSPGVERRVRERLGEDERAWERAFVLLADGFPGDLPALLDTAQRDTTPSETAARLNAKNEDVAWLVRLAPEAMRPRLLSRLAPWPLSRLAAARNADEIVEALIDTGDREAWAALFGGTRTLASRSEQREADVERAFLRRDDPQINEWLLTGLVRPTGDKGYLLAPAVRLALLEGRPFGPGGVDPLPRTPAVHALIEAGVPLTGRAELLRLCHGSREPGLVAQALRASLVEPDTGEDLLTPYQQLLAGIRLWESGHVDELRELRPGPAARTPDGTVREAFARALAEDSVDPLRAAAEASRARDEHLDEALSVWGLLLPHRIHLYTRSELAAVGRAITEDRSYRVDWDLVRSRLADPAVRHHSKRARERYGLLRAHADCPPDVASALADPVFSTFDLLRLYADRDLALAALTRENLGSGPLGAGAWPVMELAVPRPGWAPAVTPEDVLGHARPVVEGLLAAAPYAAVGAIVDECSGRAEGAGPEAEAGFWLALWSLTGYFAGPLPRLLRTAVRLAGGGAPVDTVPAADFLVGPDRDAEADTVRERLGLTTGPWLHAVRLLAGDFAGTLPELLDAASAGPAPQPDAGPRLRTGPAALLALAPREVVDAVVGGLDEPTRVVLARTTRHEETLRALVRHGGRLVHDALLDAPRVARTTAADDFWEVRELREELVLPALLALDDPWVNARLVRETCADGTVAAAATASAVLAGRPFGPREQSVPVLPGLRADFADWDPDCGAELPRWTYNPHFHTSPEPVLAMQALMYVRQSNYQDPPTSVLGHRESLLAASTIAHAGRFDLLEYVVTHWHVRYPYGQCQEARDLYARAVRGRTAAELDLELSGLD
ncbi:hypothetical protein [Streptomyces sp. NPDC008265]|uniref:hypothetical protein n=1 Tax=Streptomyces sp. NPDC008265 TaxID=3364824 RepID=UPI0036E6185D